MSPPPGCRIASTATHWCFQARAGYGCQSEGFPAISGDSRPSRSSKARLCTLTSSFRFGLDCGLGCLNNKNSFLLNGRFGCACRPVGTPVAHLASTFQVPAGVGQSRPVQFRLLRLRTARPPDGCPALTSMILECYGFGPGTPVCRRAVQCRCCCHCRCRCRCRYGCRYR